MVILLSVVRRCFHSSFTSRNRVVHPRWDLANCEEKCLYWVPHQNSEANDHTPFSLHSSQRTLCTGGIAINQCRRHRFDHGVEKTPRVGKTLQYSCPGNPMGRGAWWAIVHGIAKESDTTERAHTPAAQGACCNLPGTIMLRNCLHIVPVRNE